MDGLYSTLVITNTITSDSCYMGNSMLVQWFMHAVKPNRFNLFRPRDNYIVVKYSNFQFSIKKN